MFMWMDRRQPLNADPVIPLWEAAEDHDTMRVRQLLAHSTNTLELVNKVHPLAKTTPLMAACIQRDMSHKKPSYSAFDVVRILVEYGADVRAYDEAAQGNTALHYAAGSDQVRTVEYLLRMGADAFALNKRGHAPIDIARWFEKGHVRDLLTQYMRVRQGWVYVKKPSQRGLDMWKKRFCVALACDSARSRLEFNILRDPDDFRPLAVMFFRVGEIKMVELPAETGTWSKKSNLFAFERPVAVQEHRPQEKFSRHQDLPEGSETFANFQFATDDPSERATWLALFQATQPTLQQIARSSSGHLSAPVAPLPTVTIQSPPELQPTQTSVGDAISPSQENDNLMASSPNGQEEVDDSLLKEQTECVICMTAQRNAICVPCGHVAGCFECLHRHALTSKKCPICRSFVQTVIRVYM
ncbi:hypothetical protein Poli38472_002486 [Pythium oligandrum]|uniref:RING-type domain-containing protein n=1 Tax=Pythium oligandrum TaxID=41045 RepID=A0A8K1CIX2_PYTOL|nr:hypothetical protein Poli38472_002486 [Pythium oligandrum]|eukprot:TMW63545.1 hypothetical protein Poli38472_002486 [Pythium oligandrum]